MRRRFAWSVLVLLLTLTTPRAASAFCGFYVSGADAQLYNNATLVVLMRSGTRTVLSMQNNYQGPPADFAMVVPVPVVLQEDQVKTLPRQVFEHIDRLSAPRLVEYWEHDPCSPYEGIPIPARTFAGTVGTSTSGNLGVVVEARFEVGEYQIAILGANDSAGLETWLKRERYRIPDGAEPLLRPYVAAGMKFFVARVDTDKVAFKDGQAMLSPLRFHFDAEQFNLPIRLGLMNSRGTQDLLVHILAPGQRYEVANYPNITIPTNLELETSARDHFGTFYAALFDAALAEHPGAVVTEYAWNASTCDPCPLPALHPFELATLGADVIPHRPGGMVLTRLHARYTADALGADLVFRAAPAIVGGRERRSPDGVLERGAVEGARNNFQGRYIIRHEWTGEVACAEPMRGIWGGPPGGSKPPVRAAQELAFAPRGQIPLDSFLTAPVDARDVRQSAGDPGLEFKSAGLPGRASGRAGGCGSCAADGRIPTTTTGLGGLSMAALVGLLAVARRRRHIAS